MTGEEAKRAILAKGYTIKEIALKLGISQQTFAARFNARFFKPEYQEEITNVTGIQFTEGKSDSELLAIIESQQRTIESLTRSLETAVSKINIQ